MASKDAPKTFWQVAARHRDNVAQPAFAFGQPIRQDLPKSGYKSELRLHVFGTIGVTAGTVTDPDALSNWFPFIGIKSSQGGYLHSYSMRDLIDWNNRMFRGVGPLMSPRFAGINIGSTSTQNIDVTVVVPISLNDGINVETGLLNTQNGRNTFTVELICANVSDLVGTGSLALANPALTVSIDEIYYDAVDNQPNVIPPKFNAIVKLRTESHAGMAAGSDFDIPYPVNPTLIDAMHRVVENSAAAHVNVSAISMKSNFTQQIERRFANDIREENYRAMGKDPRAGMFWINFCDDGSGINESRMRDWINSLAATQLDTFVTTKSGFNTTGSRVDSLYREVVPLAVYGG